MAPVSPAPACRADRTGSRPGGGPPSPARASPRPGRRRRGAPRATRSISPMVKWRLSRRRSRSDSLQRPVPQPPDHVGAGMATAVGPHPGPVTHLGQGGAEPGHVGRLVAADVGHQGGRGTVPGHQVGVAQYLLGPSEAVEGRDLDQQEADHPADHHLQGEVDVVGQDPLVDGRPTQPFELSRTLGPGVDAHPAPAWSPSGRRSPGARRRCPGRRTTCGRDRPGRRSPTRPGRGPRTARGRCGRWRCRPMSSSKARATSGTGRCRSIPPNPSTVPMRVRELMIGLGRPGADEQLGLGHVGEVLGPGVEGHVEDGGGELLPALLLPGLDGRPTVLGPGRDVAALVVEAAVAAHARRPTAARRWRGRPATRPR